MDSPALAISAPDGEPEALVLEASDAPPLALVPEEVFVEEELAGLEVDRPLAEGAGFFGGGVLRRLGFREEELLERLEEVFMDCGLLLLTVEIKLPQPENLDS